MILRTLALAAALTAASAAAQAPPQPLTLERVFAAPSLAGSAPRGLKLSPDGRLVTLLRNRADDLERYDLWAIDPATGAARMLVDSKALGSGAALSEAEKMQRERARIGNLKGIVDYAWAPDGKTILVPLDGDLYLADLSGKVRRLTNTPGSELNATVSDTGRYVSFVRDGNVVVLDVTTETEKPLTSGASDTVSWGVAEFIAQEEMNRTEGLWWAPGDRRVAVARVDESPVALVTRTSIGADKTTTVQQRYPAAGTANALVDLYLMNPDGTAAVKADLGADPDVYLARVDWLPDGKAAIVQRQSRDQSRLDFLRVDAATGASTLLFSDISESFVSLTDDLKPLADGSLIFSSERSGFRHLYRWKNGRVAPLTRGKWQVDDVVGVDEERGRIFFRANREASREYQLHALDYRRSGAQPLRLTRPGANTSVEMDESGRLAIISRNAPNQPTQVYLADGSGKRLAWIDENRIEGAHPLAPYYKPITPVYGRLTAANGVTPLDYRLIMPASASGAKAPVLVTVYGGPQSQDVQTKFVSPLDRYLLQQGFALFQVANRGQAGRGVAFQRPSFKALGTVEVEDQLAALTWLKAQPGIDPARVSVYGWSYGGFMVLKLLQAAPGAFAAGIAGAPVTRWDLYDTHYTEHYLGDPRTNRAGYGRADALQDATKIRDPLMLIHGLSDDNVLFQNSTELMARLQEGKVPFETMLYPGRTHAISGPNVSVHVWRTILDFLDRRGLAPRR
jgi:dipeptidyl-peptidase-4